jgi:hypothetical protein
VVAGISHPQPKLFYLYPNPVKDQLYVMPEKSGEYTAIIQDMLGKTMGTWNLNGSGYIDISTLVSGTYIIKLLQDNQVITKKIVKE